MSSKIASFYADIGAKDTLTSTLKSIGGQLLGFTSVAGIAMGAAKLFGDSINLAAESETGMARLNATLIATGRGAQISAKQIDLIATALMKTSTFDDEAIVNAYNALSKFESIPTKGMEAVVKTAMDMSAALGGELADNAESIGRALETGVIPRTWGFNAALKAQFKAQVDAGNSAGALKTMMDELNKRYGGQAAAQMETYAGKVSRVKIAWSEMLEAVGKHIIPVLSETFDFITLKSIPGWETLGVTLGLVAQRSVEFGESIKRTLGILGDSRLSKFIDSFFGKEIKFKGLDEAAKGFYELGDAIATAHKEMEREGADKVAEDMKYLAEEADRAAQSVLMMGTNFGLAFTGADSVAERATLSFDLIGRGLENMGAKGSEIWQGFLIASGKISEPAMREFLRIQQALEVVKVALSKGVSVTLIIDYLIRLGVVSPSPSPNNPNPGPSPVTSGWVRLGTRNGPGTGSVWRNNVTGANWYGTLDTDRPPGMALGGYVPGRYAITGDSPSGRPTGFEELVDFDAKRVYSAPETRAMGAVRGYAGGSGEVDLSQRSLDKLADTIMYGVSKLQ
jgi:hypothetical protein